MSWALLVAGIVATVYSWQTRQPLTTSDFTLFYESARQPPAAMYTSPPGAPRGNMNPPHFQLIMRPLTLLPLPVASEVFRAVSVAVLCGCLWWIARASPEPWDIADVGALLAWAPMASMISLNQVTWLLWPLLLWTWWCWRHDRWDAGAVGLGLALSIKSFLGVFLLWLLIRKRWRAAVVTMATTALAFGAGLLVYGIDAHRQWVRALGDVVWWQAGMNASLQGTLSRFAHAGTAIIARTVWISVPAPTDLVRAISLAGAATIVALTLWRTRDRTVDDSWPMLMISALLASPLGWLYYIWWIMPGTRPFRLLRQSPLLWMPLAYLGFQPNRWATLTIGSVYFWGLLLLWVRGLAPTPPTPTPAFR